MIRIALVGGIGSGKTFISKLFRYPVFNADESVAKIYLKNKKVFFKLKKKLPNFFNNPPVKKEELIKAIIKNKNNIKKISKIVHPEVRKDLQKFIDKNSKKKVVILDIPLLLENKLEKKVDFLVYIDAKKNEILKNLKKRKNYNSKMIKILKKFQLPLKLKKNKANFIIKNNFKPKIVKKNVKLLKEGIFKKWKKLF